MSRLPTNLPCLMDPLPGAGVSVALCPAPAPVRDHLLQRRSAPVGAPRVSTRRKAMVLHPGDFLARAGRCSARSPGALWPPAPLESVDGWPLATPDTRFLGGAASWDPPFAGVVHGVRTPHPRAVCRSQPPPARAARLEHLRADRR
jgi:hypothetical protein